MKNTEKIAVLFLCGVLVASGPTKAASPRSRTFALVVTGISRDLDDRLATAQALHDLRNYLCEDAGLDPNRVTVLAGGDFGTSDPNARSTAQKVKAALDALAAMIGPQDRLLFWYVGQANAVSEKLRFNLPGPDLEHEDVASSLNAIRASEQLIVLDCPCAALAAKSLARPERIILCASTAAQAYSTAFTARFVPALRQAKNDTDANGRVSVLEAFTATARETERSYQQMQCLVTETPCLEDNADGVLNERPWRYQADGGDGAKAASFFLTAGQQETIQTNRDETK